METRIPLVTHMAVALGRAAAGPSWRPGALSHLSSYFSVCQMGKRSATADSDTKTQLTLPGKTWKSLWLPFILFASGAFRCRAGTEQRALPSRNSCGDALRSQGCAGPAPAWGSGLGGSVPVTQRDGQRGAARGGRQGAP